jgi:hypothetical protein
MVRLDKYLKIDRCPHCSVAKPTLEAESSFTTTADNKSNTRFWAFYACSTCGGVTTAWAYNDGDEVQAIFPTLMLVDPNLPIKIKTYLQQAIDTQHAPSGSLMLCASAVDAMLKEKGFIDGSLYKRIDEAAGANIITPDMAKWAHRVRLDANEQRHADTESDLPTTLDAQQGVEFTKTLAELMFTLPGKVDKGLKETEKPK